MDKALATITNRFRTELMSLIDARDYLGPAEWQRQFQQAVIQSHAAAYFAGQGYNGLSPAGDRELGQLFQVQFAYLNRFAQEIDQLSEAQAKARAALYAGALKETYSRGQFAIWRLPYHPGQGTPCRGNCRCEWKITVLNLEELNADARWVLGDAEHCNGCVSRAARNPYRIRAGVLLS